MLLGVCVLLGTHCLQKVIIDDRYLEIAVNALREAGHFGVVVPVELLALGNDDEEQGEQFLTLNGQGDDAMRGFDLHEHFVEFRHSDLFDFCLQEFKVVGLAESGGGIIRMFVGDGLDEVEQVFQGATGG